MMIPVTEASKKVSYHASYIGKLIRDNTIQGTKLQDGRLYVDMDSLIQYTKRQTRQDLRELGHHITKTTGRLFCSRCGAAVSGDPLIFEQCKFF